MQCLSFSYVYLMDLKDWKQTVILQNCLWIAMFSRMIVILVLCSNILMFLLSSLPSLPLSLFLSVAITFSANQSLMPWKPALSPWATRGAQSHSGTVGFDFTLNPPAPVKLSHPACSPSSLSPPAPLSPPSWPPQAHLDSQPAFSLHEGRREVPGALDVDPQPLHLNSPENLRDLGQRSCHDVSTITGNS